MSGRRVAGRVATRGRIPRGARYHALARGAEVARRRFEAEATLHLDRTLSLPDPDPAHAENAEGPKPEANPCDKGR